MKHFYYAAVIAIVLCLSMSVSAQNYNGFKASVYITSGDVSKMTDTKWLESAWAEITKGFTPDKVYIETYRDGRYTPEAALIAAKKFFKSKKVDFSGGITFTVTGDGKFKTFCYTSPESRAEVQKIAEYTAKHFDEVILDDFFFNTCKCPECTKAKGDQSWTDFRIKLMNDVAANLLIGPAKAVNPKCKFTIKYPNWYEHFPASGFDLGAEAKLFNGIWTGTETRNPDADQHLQAYLGYEIFRYFDNIAPGKNGGGWIDAGGMRYADRYAEQIWLTLFAKAPECAIFEFSSLQRPVGENYKGAWQGTGTSFDWKELGDSPTIAKLAGVSYDVANKVYSKLGRPIGIKSYKPIGSVGEDFLQTYLGMVGLPIEMVPEFPFGEQMVLLTEQAAYDKNLVAKIKQHLKDKNSVIITTGLLKVIKEELGDIVELRINDNKGSVDDFGHFGKSDKKITIPQVYYYTNDAWEDIPAIDDGVTGWPMLMQARYEDGSVWVLTIPDSFAGLYRLPAGVLNRIRAVAGPDVPVRLEGPANVSLFVYDNNTFIVESFLDEPVTVKVVLDATTGSITDLITNETIKGQKTPDARIWLREAKDKNAFEMTVKPHSFRAFKR